MFHGSKMIIKNITDNRILVDVDCGGGHRSWDISCYNKNAGNSWKMVFIKDKKVMRQRFSLQEDIPEFSGGHTQTTKTVTAFRYLVLSIFYQYYYII